MNIKLCLFLAFLSGYPAFGQEGECEVYDQKKIPNIYQRIWDADQNKNGIPAILPTQDRPGQGGYVVTDVPANSALSNLDVQNHKIHPEVSIPTNKMNTYNLVKKLFDNYTLNQKTSEEIQTEEEKKEVEAFIDAIFLLEPMCLAKSFIEEKQSIPMRNEDWKKMIKTIWFDTYKKGNSPNRSGFEHVFVGDQNDETLGGYHFWYKYWLDDGGNNEDNRNEDLKESIYYDNPSDNINYVRNEFKDFEQGGIKNPDVATVRYSLNAIDFENDLQTVPLKKPIGGHFVGCSPEGLIALGLVAFHEVRNVETVINDQKYKLEIFRAPDGCCINTFYPKFYTDKNEEEAFRSDSVRIVAALVNPPEEDKGNETVTLKNPTNATIDITGWKIKSNNNKESVLDKSNNLKLDAGEEKSFILDGEGAQFVNKPKGLAKITLLDDNGIEVDTVTYSRDNVQSGVNVTFESTVGNEENNNDEL